MVRTRGPAGGGAGIPEAFPKGFRMGEAEPDDKNS